MDPNRCRGRAAPFLLIVIAAVVAGGLGAWLAGRVPTTAAPDDSAFRSLKRFGAPRELPAAPLQQSDGTELTREELAGRHTLVFIGFTHCPDVCPTALAQLAAAERRWQEALPADQRPQVLFVSVDPARDTPERVGEYARYFDPGFLGATGDDAVLQPFVRALAMVYHRNEPDPRGNYAVDHSAAIAVLDPQARAIGVLPAPHDPETIAADLVTLIRGGP